MSINPQGQPLAGTRVTTTSGLTETPPSARAMVLAKSDLDIGHRYSLLAEPKLRFIHANISTELQLAQTLILNIKQTDQRLNEDETLQRAIRLRNPYVDPLNLLQIKLLQEWRATERKDDAILAALFETVNGIARGIQNTG